jgi:hypothetical protein
MAKVLQVIDVDSNGHCVRLDDGRIVVTPHGGDHPQVGEEFPEPEDADALIVEKLKEFHAAKINEAINVIIQQRGRICDLERQLEDSKALVSKLQAELRQLSEVNPVVQFGPDIEVPEDPQEAERLISEGLDQQQSEALEPQ